MSTFSISNTHLLPALSTVISLVDKKNTLQLLTCVHVHVTGSSLTLYANDVQNQIQVHDSSLDLQLDQPLSFLINAKRLHDVLKNTKLSEQIHFELDDAKIKIKIRKANFEFATLPVADYPHESFAEVTSAEVQLNMAPALLADLMESTSYAMAVQDLRFYLNGMLLHSGDGGIRAAATDAHRMSLSSASISQMPEQAFEWIIPRKAVLEVLKLSKQDNSESIRISQHGRSLVFSFGERTQFRTKLIEGRFPNADRVIPQDPLSVAHFNCAEAIAALTRVELFTSEKFKGVRFRLSSQQLQVHAINNENEEGMEVIAVDYEGPELEVGLNIHYVLEYLRNAKTSDIAMKIKNPETPSMFVEQNRDSIANMYILMPMKI